MNQKKAPGPGGTGRVTPHAKSLVDLADRVEVAWAYSPTAARREGFAARFRSVTGDFAVIAEDRSIDAVLC
jgi:predicted dehydrogenase